MTPPEPPQDGNASPGDRAPAVSVCPECPAQAVGPTIQVLIKRADFLRASRAARRATGTMIVQARKRPAGQATGIRVGFTCSKKVGNAVARNRAKRRLRAAMREVLPHLGQDGWDYVLIGRHEKTIAAPFETLLHDLTYAVKKLHNGRKQT